nr:TetR/AcrR family transcriptional regulator [Conexibacter arvalis]
MLEAAAQVFERHGYAAGTTNRIAERAGVSIGSLYQYFPNKDALLLAIVERHVAEGAERLGPLLAALRDERPPLRAGLERIVAAMVALHAERPALHRVLFEEAPRPPALRRRLDALATAATAAVADWLRAVPEVRVADPKLAARLVVQVTESVTHNLVIHADPDRSPDRWAAETVALLEAYLGSAASSG